MLRAPPLDEGVARRVAVPPRSSTPFDETSDAARAARGRSRSTGLYPWLGYRVAAVAHVFR